MDLTIIIPLCTAIIGAVIAILTLNKSSKKDHVEEGATKGSMASDIGYIKAGVDDLKNENRTMRAEVSSLRERVSSVEESCRIAHKRIDDIDNELHK